MPATMWLNISLNTSSISQSPPVLTDRECLNVQNIRYLYFCVIFTACNIVLVFSFSTYFPLFFLWNLNSVDSSYTIFQRRLTCSRLITCTSRTVGQELWRDQGWMSTSLVMCRLFRFTAWVEFCTRYLQCCLNNACHAALIIACQFGFKQKYLYRYLLQSCLIGAIAKQEIHSKQTDSCSGLSSTWVSTYFSWKKLYIKIYS